MQLNFLASNVDMKSLDNLNLVTLTFTRKNDAMLLVKKLAYKILSLTQL